eukprot:5851632-Pyramimonas_sp.AAC.1
MQLMGRDIQVQGAPPYSHPSYSHPPYSRGGGAGNAIGRATAHGAGHTGTGSAPIQSPPIQSPLPLTVTLYSYHQITLTPLLHHP